MFCWNILDETAKCQTVYHFFQIFNDSIHFFQVEILKKIDNQLKSILL